MSSLDELIAKAKMLHSEGHSPSQIADELSLSMETVTWLLTQQKDTEAPKDVHIDWTAIAGHADLLQSAACMMLAQYYHDESRSETAAADPEPDVVVGIGQSGIPLATLIAAEEGCNFTMYYPKKHAVGEKPKGSLSGSFAKVAGARCLIIDDLITSGNTIREVVDYLRSHGGDPVGICVLFDKRGVREVDGVPVHSLVKISRID